MCSSVALTFLLAASAAGAPLAALPIADEAEGDGAHCSWAAERDPEVDACHSLEVSLVQTAKHMHFISPAEGATSSGLVESVVEAAGQVEMRNFEESFTADTGVPAALVAAKRSWASDSGDAQGNESAIGLGPTGRKANSTMLAVSPSGATQPEHGSSALAREVLGASSANNTCECIGLSHSLGAIQVSIKGQPVEYPAEAGATCKAWDAGRHPLCQGLGTDPFWCKQQWCYVDPCTCKKGYDEPIPSEITYVPGATSQGKSIFYSYHACHETDTYTAVENKQACANKKSHYQCGTLAGCAWRPDLGGCVGGDLVSSCGLSATQTAAVTKAAKEKKVAADTIFLLEGRSGALQASSWWPWS